MDDYPLYKSATDIYEENTFLKEELNFLRKRMNSDRDEEEIKKMHGEWIVDVVDQNSLETPRVVLILKKYGYYVCIQNTSGILSLFIRTPTLQNIQVNNIFTVTEMKMRESIVLRLQTVVEKWLYFCSDEYFIGRLQVELGFNTC